jgi:serine/threonine-protein kinase RsbW
LQRQFKKAIASLESIFRYIDEFASSNNIDEDSRRAISFAVEELFTNMVKYNPEGTRDVSIALQLSGKRFTASLTDHDVRPFDPTALNEVNVNAPIEERKPGGLGIFLTKKLMDDIKFQHINGNNIITLVKNLE